MDIAELIVEMRNMADDLEGPNSARWEDVLQLNWKARSLLHATEEWQRIWKRQQVHPVTKWDLISDRQRDFFEQTLLGRVIDCKSCGHSLATEADFAKHFVVTNIDYTNLGTCWTRVCPEYAGTRPEWVLPAPDDKP